MTRTALPTYYLVVGVLVTWWLASALAFTTLPAVMPMHFDLSGAADGPLRPRGPIWFIFPAIASMALLIAEPVIRIALVHPDLVNVPNKGNFLAMSTDEREPVLRELHAMLHLVLLSGFAVLATVQLGVYQAARSGAVALPSWVIPIIITALAANAVVVMRSYRRVSARTTSRPAASPR